MSIYIPILATLVGGILALTGIMISARSSRSSEHRKVVREKLEQAYQLCLGHETWALDCLKLGNAESENSGGNHLDNIELLVSCYSPRNSYLVDTLREHSGQLASAFYACLTETIETGKKPVPLTFEGMREPFKACGETTRALRRALIASIRTNT